jgi:hypothetical protein
MLPGTGTRTVTTFMFATPTSCPILISGPGDLNGSGVEPGEDSDDNRPKDGLEGPRQKVRCKRSHLRTSVLAIQRSVDDIDLRRLCTQTKRY